MILENLIFHPFKIGCPECAEFIAVELEDLRLNNEVCCPLCGIIFFPNMNLDILLSLIKTAKLPDFQRALSNDG